VGELFTVQPLSGSRSRSSEVVVQPQEEGEVGLKTSVCESVRAPLSVAESKVDPFDHLTLASTRISSHENPRESGNPFTEGSTTAELEGLMKETRSECTRTADSAIVLHMA